VAKPTNLELQAIYNDAAAIFDEVSHPYSVSRRREALAAWASGDCLEVGAGTGEISRALLERGLRVTATDISPNMVARIQNKMHIEALVCDAETLPFADASFDTVVAAEVIYYLDHPEVFLREAFRVLRPGGRLVLSSANNGTAKFYERARAFLRKFGVSKMYFDDKLKDFMTTRKLRSLLEIGGFEVEDMQKVIVLPFGFLDGLNRVLEKTAFKHFGIFLLARAKKK
jgi:ubiquinone/menaquinone biosynthesis C-methylase UbiE